MSVIAERVTGPTGVDMAHYAIMRFEDDVVARVEASFVAPSRQHLEVVCDQGVLIAPRPWRIDNPSELQLVREGVAEVVKIPEANSYQRELENMADAIAGSAPPLLGREDALGQARAIEALYGAAVTGAPVKL